MYEIPNSQDDVAVTVFPNQEKKYSLLLEKAFGENTTFHITISNISFFDS